MATTPHPAPKPKPKPEEDDAPRGAPLEGYPPEKDPADPNQGMITTQEEQLRRSREIEAEGVDAWKDKRAADPANRPVQHKNSTGQVPGVGPASARDPGRE